MIKLKFYTYFSNILRFDRICVGYILVLSLAVLLLLPSLACRAPQMDVDADIVDVDPFVSEDIGSTPSPMDEFIQDAFEEDLKIFQQETSYDPNDPDLELKQMIDEYLFSRHIIKGEYQQPYDETNAALQTMLSHCDDSFRSEAKMTMWYWCYILKSRGIDLSYAELRHRTEYKDIKHEADEVRITVLDAVQFRHTFDPDVLSSSGDTHVIRLHKVKGEWKITEDDPGSFLCHLNEQYREFVSECPYSEESAIEQYVMDRWTAPSNKPQLA